MTRLRRAAPWLALVGGLLLVALVAGAPRDGGGRLDPRGTGPAGTKGLVLLLRELGASVEISDRVPDGGGDPSPIVVLVLLDDLADAQRVALDAWVRGGGTLVVSDPASALHPGLAVAEAGGPLGEASVGRGVCEVAALGGIERIDPGGGVLYGPVPGGEQCIGSADAAFVVVAPQGEGTVVALGGPGPFTNARLSTDDNAVLAGALLAPVAGTRVVVLERALPGAGEETLGDLLPDRVRDALLQLAVAFAVVALWRGRRLGRPVTEPGVLDLPGSELVEASGRLRRRAGHPERAAALLRADVRRQLAGGLGLPPTASLAMVAEAAASRTGRSTDELAAVLGDGPVPDEDALLDLARRLETLRRSVLVPAERGEPR